LTEGSIDLGIVVLPVELDQFECVPLIERELRLVIHPQHRLAHKRDLQFKDLKDEPFIMFRQGFTLYDRVKEACIREGFEPNMAFESTQWDFMCELVQADLGIAFLPETVCENLDPQRFTVIGSLDPPIRWDIGLVWRKGNSLSYASR